MHETPASSEPLPLAIDMMGGDAGVAAVAEGLSIAIARGLKMPVELYGREGEIKTAITALPGDMQSMTIHHQEDVVSMTDKPSSALRRGRSSSMWAAVNAVKEGRAAAAVSSGNTGALMAMSVFQLRMIDGIDRPAISALWPTATGNAVVLDVGANIGSTAPQLVQFAVMGEAYFRALTGKEKPTVGLLNVGAEDMKGHETLKTAAESLRQSSENIAFHGFVEGDDISAGRVDVVVTDGFTGNIALKTAEGTAHLIGDWVKRTLTTSWRSKLAALLMMPALKALKNDMDPARVNGAPLLGLNGLVLKSHGGADASGVASAILRAERLATHPFKDEISKTVQRISMSGPSASDETDSADIVSAAE